MLNDPILIRNLQLKNRLVMPPMQSNHSLRGHVTDDLVAYYRARALGSEPGLIIAEHCCISEAGRADSAQLSIAEDSCIAEHRRLTDAVHEAGSRIFIQMNHAGNAAEPFDGGELVSASDVPALRKTLQKKPRPLTAEEIRELEQSFVRAAQRAVEAGYDGVEIHSAHGYLLDQFYSPLTNRREDEYGAGSMENRLRFLLETVAAVRGAVGEQIPVAVRLGGADYLPGGATEEDAVEACCMLEQAKVDLLDLSGGMCGFVRQGHPEPGYFGTMTEKIKTQVSIPVMLTGGVTTTAEAETLLREGKADLIGVGRALFRDPDWRKNQTG